MACLIWVNFASVQALFLMDFCLSLLFLLLLLSNSEVYSFSYMEKLLLWWYLRVANETVGEHILSLMLKMIKDAACKLAFPHVFKVNDNEVGF